MRGWKFVLPLACTLLFWASAFVGIRATLSAYSPAHLALLRFLVASGVLLIVMLVRRSPLPRAGDVPLILTTGFLGISVYNLALNIGEQTVSASAASFLVNTVPIFTTLLAAVFLRERLTLRGWLGVGVGFFGATLIALGEVRGLRLGVGALFVLLAALSQAGYFVLQKPLLSRSSPLVVTTYALWSGTLFLLPFAPGLGEAVRAAPAASTVAVIYLGVFPAAIAYLTWSMVLARVPASKAAPFLYLVPLLTVAIAWVWLRERPTLLSFLGGAVVIIGVTLMRLREADGAVGRVEHEEQLEAQHRPAKERSK